MAGGNIRSHNKSFESDQMDKNAKFENFMNQNTNRDHAQFFTTPPPIQKSFKDYLNLNQGGVLASPLGWNPSVATISSGAIDIGRDSGKLAGFVIIAAESGTADDLTDINNFVYGYQDLTILADAGDTITVKNTGNINITEDLVLTDSQAAMLFYNIVSNSWEVKGGIGDGGGGGTSTPPWQYGLTLIATTSGNVVLDLDPGSNSQGQHFIFSNELTGDVDITFSSTPSDGFSQPYIIEYTLGDDIYNVTFNDNPDVTPIAGTANAKTKLAGYITNNSGVITSTFTMTSTAGSGGGGGGENQTPWLSDIDANTFDLTNLDRLLFVDDGSAVVATDVTQMLLNSSGSFQTNTATGNDFVWTIENDTVATIAIDGNSNGVLTVQSPDDSGGAVINLLRNDVDGTIPTPIVIGSYGFYTGTTTPNTVYEYASIQANAESIAAGFGVGSLDLLAAVVGEVQEIFLSINDGGNDLVDIFKQMDMNTNKIVNVVDPTADQDAATKNYVDSTSGSPVTTKGDLFGYDTGNARIPVGADDTVLIADSAVTLGVKWGTVSSLGFATTELDNLGTTAVNANINMGSNDLTFNPSTTLLGSASATQFNLEFAGDTSEFHIVYDTDTTPVSAWEFTKGSLSGASIALSNSLSFTSSGADPTVDGQFTRNGNEMALQTEAFNIRNDTSVTTEFSELSIIKVDADPQASDFVGRLNFGVDDSGTTVNYAGVYGAAKEITDSGILQLIARSNNGQNTIGIQIEGDDDETRTYATYNAKTNSDFTFGAEDGVGGTFKIGPDLDAGAGVELGLSLIHI